MLDPTAAAGRLLRDGALVAVHPSGAPATVLDEPSGIAEVRVAGGPSAGSVHRLGIGATTIGTASDVDVRLSDPSVPSHALRVTVESRRVTVAGAGTLDQKPLEGMVEWPPGGVLEVGATVLTLGSAAAPDAHLSALEDGGLAYNRPPRIRPESRPRRIEVPQEPEKGQRERLRLLGSLLFAATGVVMVIFTGQWYWALMALAYPVIQVGEWIADRLYGRKSYKKSLKEYRAKKASFDGALEAMRRADQTEWRTLAPDPAEVLLTATGPRRRLWERRLGDPDTLHLRFGLADLPARIELRPGRGGGDEPDLPPPPIAHSVPVPLPLAELGVVGLSGARDRSRALARWLVAQAAALHSPRDLAIVVLSADPAAGRHWNWVRWLPHCAPREGEDCVALIGTDPDTVARRVTELAIRITERRRSAEPSFGAAPTVAEGSYNILLVLDGARQLRRVPGMPQVLSGGPDVGLHAICIDDDERLLPEECTAVAVWDWDRPTHVRLHGNGLDSVGAVLADQVTPAWCDRLARALAPVRDVSRDDAESMIPPSARLLELLRMPSPTAAQIQSVWQAGGRTTWVPIGVSADGVFSVDLRRDGPHGLIAGTTGAGKSELLQTLIASLAVANRPDEMTFVLIDYKGGAAFADCASLPHVVGMVTDLDGHLTERALESLGAELRRRESLLLHAGAKDIEDYCELFDTGDRRASVRVPRLVLVIDEFAAMVGELPDFVEGLVDIGRRGRSLGVHLLLATQRPAGVVTGDIRANTNLRVALRVTDPDESSDVLDDPSAARISKSAPGRCYVRSGAAAPVAVQAARIGGRRPGNVAAVPAQVVPLPWARLGHSLSLAAPAEDESSMVTDLKVLVSAIREACDRAGVEEQAPPWLEPLPPVVTLDDLPAVFADEDDVAPLAFGLTDLPSAQSRSALTLDLVHGGHLYVAGSSRSGRSTVLRTLAGALASSCSPADVHLYAIDCGANALLPLVALPHCGAVVGRDQIERMERLLARLHTEVSRRQQALAATGFASLAEQRAAVAPSERFPWMVLMLDRWEGFVSAFENYDYGRLIDAVLRLLREGSAVGLRAVFTGDRSGLGGQVSTVFDDRLILRMSDPNDYVYAGVSERQVPSEMFAGRALEAMGAGSTSLRESQIALLAPDAAGAAQVAALQLLGREAERAYGRPSSGLRPLHVDELPVRVTYSQALGLDPDFVAPSPLWALVGAGGDELGPIGVDLTAEGPGFTVAGPPRSGRSTVLMTMVASLLDPDIGEGAVPVVLICPRRSPLRFLENRPGVLAVLGADADEDALLNAIGHLERYVIVIDDAELMYETPLDDTLADLLRQARDGEHGMIIAGIASELARTFQSFLASVPKSRVGVLLAIESVDDGEILGARLPRNIAIGSPSGRSLYIQPGASLPIQVAVCP
ncbi:FtsK/SpoIIIE domain-containing protein [Actinomadura sp. DC4]|uniref:FtsK/SpoIIIE domain-containing protein n=1 Tax=Actinomadura sp. DC4 TaxID=3055069 RepID=UPI0025B12071|nr:FtsK/SpoIIIE domain-containing protein [Actinomadura sp. DC4]MDN3357076.1 FtsK/SpoIIIE domain-containing protein [Actinomadura sp. DC4]